MTGFVQIPYSLQLGITACLRCVPKGSSEILQAMQDSVVIGYCRDGKVRVAVLDYVRNTHSEGILRDYSITSVTLHSRANTPTFACAEISQVALRSLLVDENGTAKRAQWSGIVVKGPLYVLVG